MVILDEPTSGLDPLGTLEMKNLIKELKKAGKTVLLSSHQLADVEDVCDRVCILYRGKLEVEGTVDELLQVRDVFKIEGRNVPVDVQEKLVAMMREAGVTDIQPGLQRIAPRRCVQKAGAGQACGGAGGGDRRRGRQVNDGRWRNYFDVLDWVAAARLFAVRMERPVDAGAPAGEGHGPGRAPTCGRWVERR